MLAMKKIVAIVLFTSLLTGCALSPDKNGKLKFKGKEIVTQQQAKAMSREQRLERIVADIKVVGFKKIKVSKVVDPVTKSILAVYKNQYNIITEYKNLLDNHKDVMSFLMANKGKSEKELDAEIARFDSLVDNDEDKIGPRIKSYRKSSDKIWQENVRVGLNITANSAELAYKLHTKSDQWLGEEGIKTLLNGSKLIDVYNLSEMRLHLAKLANEFIKDEQAIIDISKQLQDKQNSKLKG